MKVTIIKTLGKIKSCERNQVRWNIRTKHNGQSWRKNRKAFKEKPILGVIFNLIQFETPATFLLCWPKVLKDEYEWGWVWLNVAFLIPKVNCYSDRAINQSPITNGDWARCLGPDKFYQTLHLSDTRNV